MTINGFTYTEKKEAGAALIEVCKKVKSSDEVSVGTYRGFKMSLSLNHRQKHELTLKGAISHEVELSSDIYGNITRINNVIEGMADKRATCEKQLENTREQLASAEVEVTKLPCGDCVFDR